MKDIKVYRVYDTLKSEYFCTHKGKTVWPKSGSAKNAWNLVFSSFNTKFNNKEQTRYVIHKFSLVRDLEEVKE